MATLASFLRSSLFFTPFVYIAFYLYIEKRFSGQARVQSRLKRFTVLFGFFVMLYALTLSAAFEILLPSRGSNPVYIPASVFWFLVGMTILALPWFSKYIQFSNKNP